MERKALLISIGFSFFAMFFAYKYMAGQEEELQDKYGNQTAEMVVIASRDILQYETVRPDMVDVLKVPKAMLPPGRISAPTDVIDAVTAVPIRAGEFILDNKIISKNVYSGLDTQITLGNRAMSIPVNIKSSVGFMLRPGSRVDLAAHFDYRTTSVRVSEVKVFMQDLLVLASGKTIQASTPEGVDQEIVREVLGAKEVAKKKVGRDTVRETLAHAKTDSTYQTVTLEVTPEQAQIIAYVLTVYQDSVICMLRQPEDRQLARADTTNLDKVMGDDSYYRRRNRVAPPAATPLIRFFDYVGSDAVPVQSQ